MSHGKHLFLAIAYSFLSVPLMASPSETEQLCQWRTKLERIYHDARLPPKKPFDAEYPPSVIQNLVETDLHKERVLKTVYGVTVTREMLEEEIRRIDNNTKDAGTLGRIKTDLGPDEQGFAETVARPIIVERLLRQKFYQDKVIHAAEREKAINIRSTMAAGNKIEGSKEQTWLLGNRPAEASTPTNHIPPSTANSSAPSYTNQATLQFAQVIGGGDQEAKDTKQYFVDLDPELATVLKKHLQKPGDVSPIIETTSGFSIYRAKEINADHWKVESAFISRISYEDWLASKADSK